MAAFTGTINGGTFQNGIMCESPCRYSSPPSNDDHEQSVDDRPGFKVSCSPPPTPRPLRYCPAQSVIDSDISSDSLFRELNLGRSILNPKPRVMPYTHNLSRKRLFSELHKETRQDGDINENARHIHPCFDHNYVLTNPSYPHLPPVLAGNNSDDEEMPELVLASLVKQPMRIGKKKSTRRENQYFVPIRPFGKCGDEEEH